MKFKDRIIKKLLELGKKHRILVYPTLALVAVVSAVSNAVYWGRGNGKRVVASVTVMALLITQSLFLTSSANNGEAMPQGANTASETDAEYYAAQSDIEGVASDDTLASTGDETLVPTGDEALMPQQSGDPAIPAYSAVKVIVSIEGTTTSVSYLASLTDDGNGNYSLPSGFTLDSTSVHQELFGSVDPSYITYSDLYKDSGYTSSLPADLADFEKDDTEQVYLAYAYATVSKVDVIYQDEDGLGITNTISGVDGSGTTEVYNSATRELKLTLGDDAHYDSVTDIKQSPRRGYKFTGLKVKGAAYTSATPIILEPGTTSVTVQTGWTAKEVNVTFDAIDDEDGLKTGNAVAEITNQPVKAYYYTDTMGDVDATVWATPDNGYVFDTWTFDVGGSAINSATTIAGLLDLDSANVDFTAEPIVLTVPIVGTWKYKEYKLTGLAEGDKLTGTYGDIPNQSTIGVIYQTDEPDTEHLGIYIDPAVIANITSEYGILLSGDGSIARQSGYYQTYKVSNSNKISKITPQDAVTIPVSICDTNRPTSDQIMAGSEITLVFSPREITIDSSTVKGGDDKSTAPERTYTGTTDVDVVGKADVKDLTSTTGLPFGDEIIAKFDTTANFEDENAGSGKSVTVTGVVLEDKNGGTIKSNNYKIADTIELTGIGKINAKNVTVDIRIKDSDPAVKDTTVKYGMNNPTYELYIVNPSSDLLSADVSAYEADAAQFLSTQLGFSGWNFARDKYSPSGSTYTVQPEFTGDKNYNPIPTGIKGNISVDRDVATLGTNYQLSEKQSDDFYREITISPIGGYDQIRICNSESDDVTSDSQLATAGFKSTLTNADLPDMTDATIYVQMRDSSSGAITTIGKIENLNIDTNGPELDSFDVDPYSKLNIFNFGAYYHPQDNVNVLTFTFRYSSEDSACDMLYYYLEDKDGNRTDVNTASYVLESTGETTPTGAKLYKASITLSVDSYGQLIVYATDKAGNQSAYSRVNISTWDEFINNGGKPSDYYEWMVENTKTDAALRITYNGSAASTQGVLYDHIELNIDADDVVNGNPASGVNKVEWEVKDSEGTVVFTDTTYVPDTDRKYESYTFTDRFPVMGAELLGMYYVGATVYDNAGNSVEVGPEGPYAIDSILPVITDKTESQADGGFLSGVQFKFQVDEGVGESGIDYITLYQKTGAGEADWTALEQWSNLSGDELYSKLCSYNITENGTYVVIAYDKAGNKSVNFEKTFTGISDVVPDAPTIRVAVGTKNEDSGWYIETKPNVKITTNNMMSNGVPVTSDGVPLHTDYTITVAGTSTDIQRTFTASEYPFYLDYEGEVTITAVNVSASNKRSPEATAVIKVDTVKPVIKITGSTIDTSGNLVVNYEISDATSGVNRARVTINDEATLVDEPNVSGTVAGSFVAQPGITYSIEAEDIAGNVADVVEFKPLALDVSPVTNITTNSALLNANILVGTYPLSNYYIAYKKHDAAKYSKYSLISTITTEDGIEITCPFKNLESNTVYDYMVYAVTETSKEVKEYTGSFKTGSIGSAATVYGSAKYDNALMDSLKTYPIYVTLYNGGVAIGGIEIESDASNEYYFKNVPDGSYQITATNGKLSKTASVTVANGGVTYPENYLSTNGINLVLNGLSTSVVIEDSEIELTADNLDVIYDDDFNINISQDEYDIVNEGGNILVTLHANYLNVATDVGSTTEGIIKDKLGSNAEVVRYIELYITKTVTDKYGNQTTSYITELADPITVSFPLGDLAGQRIYVASLHSGLLNNSDYDFYNWGTASTAVLTHDYVTITTSRFSVYALYRMKTTDRYFTVKWIDGDGNVMKTETVKDGESATPPTAVPTKSPTDKYTYTFEAWDVDYSTITKDTIISAWFTANKIVEPDDPKPEDPTTEDPTTEDPDPEKVPPAIVIPPTNDSGQNTSDSGNKYTYLGSVSSPKTGDTAPIIIIGLVMVISAVGLVIFTKKRKDE